MSTPVEAIRRGVPLVRATREYLRRRRGNASLMNSRDERSRLGPTKHNQSTVSILPMSPFAHSRRPRSSDQAQNDEAERHPSPARGSAERHVRVRPAIRVTIRVQRALGHCPGRSALDQIRRSVRPEVRTTVLFGAPGSVLVPERYLSDTPSYEALYRGHRRRATLFLHVGP
jgi:hypothetical protein